MVFFTLFSVLPINEIVSYAADDITVSDVEYVRQHNVYTFKSAGITIVGENLDKAIVTIFDNATNSWVQNYGTKTVIGTQMVTIKFTKEQSDAFSGRVRVTTTAGLKTFNLNTAGFPVIQSGTPSVNIDKYLATPETDDTNNIVIKGTNLDKMIDSANGFSTTIGKTTTSVLNGTNFKSTNPPATTEYRIIKPNPGDLGYQNIEVEYNKIEGGVKVYTRYAYDDAFRTLRDSKLETPIELYPNTGQSGSTQAGKVIPPDNFYIRAKKIPGSISDYDVYFLKSLDGTDKPTAANKATILSIAPERKLDNSLTGNDLLIAQVPKGIATGQYKVVLMDKEGTQIVAETYVGEYTVIAADFNPVIKRLSPGEGSDTGEFTEIIGDYLLTIRLPGIKGGIPKPEAAVGGLGTETLTLNYLPAGLTYNDINITSLKRTIKGIVGGEVTFVNTPTPPVPSSSDGVEERIPVKLQGVSDAATNPIRNAVLTIETEITVNVGGVDKVYRFVQEITKKDAYKFIPRTYLPEVTSVSPDVIQIENAPVTGTNLNRLANDVLIAINGKNFFVDRHTDSTGKLIIQYPTIQFKVGNNDSPEDYELGFFPNESGGIIKYKQTGVTPNPTLVDGSGNPIRFQITVLDAKGNVVNGTTGNELGSKILIRMPRESYITLAAAADEGLKRVQVVNPTRKSNIFGGVTVTDEILKFVRTTDIPIIQRVVPSVVTVEGKEEITIYGSNFREGMKLYLDGEEITKFTREKDISGGTDIIKFEAPPGREGVTQIAIVNPSGGMAVHNFTYVASFQQDPIIDNFAPKQGTPGTLVVINGKNFVIPDPSVPTEDGIDGFRLVGTRVYLDGKDVNTYKLGPSAEIQFQNYTAPNAQNLLNLLFGVPVYSPYKDNTTVRYEKNSDPASRRVVTLINDKNGRPAIDVGDKIYTIRNTGTQFEVYSQEGQKLDNLNVSFSPEAGEPWKGTTLMSFADGTDNIVLTAQMDNSLLRISEALDGKLQLALSTYGDSVQLIEPVTKTRYAIRYNYLGNIILYKYNFDEKEQKVSNIEKGIYFLEPYKNGNNTIVVQGSNNKIEIVPTLTGLEIHDRTGAGTVVTALTMRTPYEINTSNRIVGHRARVLNSGQIAFEVPVLTTGRGYKDVTVINPDTKTDSKTGNAGFLYIPQSSSNPVISQVKPSKGSVDGGYYVTITGSDFKDNAQVFIDSVLVPQKDTYIALNGDEIRIKMPKSIKNLNEDFGVDAMTVPVVVTNSDGGSASKLRGFTYIIPKSSPVLNSIIPDVGSSNGAEFVDLIGDEFRFYEPYKNDEGRPYQEGDDFEDLNVSGKWDDLIAALAGWNALSTADKAKYKTKMDYLVEKKLLTAHPLPESPDPNVSHYYTSPILPTVYFGNKEARIVEIDPGFIRVVTPAQSAGAVEVYIINNDSGVSNKRTYTYKTTTPKVDRMVPNFGRRQGQEPKDIFGSELFPSVIRGYVKDTAAGSTVPLNIVSETAVLDHVQAWVRFADIDNREIAREKANSGLIVSQRTSVVLEGGLKVDYSALTNSVTVQVEENNKKYSRTFTYDGSELLVPMGMLTTGTGANLEYYVPFGYKVSDRKSYKEPYEYIRLSIEDRRLYVERGYAPKVTYNNAGHVTVYTPSYYTIGQVPVTYTNTDGGKVVVPFTYTNPASEPKIYKVEPQELNFDKDRWLVYSSVDGGVDIEILGLDFRANVKVNIGGAEAKVKEITTKTIGGVTYDVIVANVPKGSAADIDLQLPIIVLNEDKGLATSSNLVDLIGPNYGEQTLPIYFVYKKPLSGPRIDTITPTKTSVAGGNKIVIIGSDFREGAYVIIGTRAGIPILNVPISERGTRIEFTTPTNMTLGEKTVQVLNSDYGIAIKEKGLTVVSAPTVEPRVLGVDGVPLSRIHVTGGQEVFIKGTGFQEGATVYFGGEYLTIKATDKIPETEKGLYRDDSYRYVKDGFKATKVEFIDEQTLKVTTPVVTFEGKVRIVVRNPDSGITGGETYIDYTVPIPEDPANLKVSLVENQYIKLYDYVAKGSDYFEIYVYIGSLSNADLIKNQYRDFSYLGITDIEPYKIIDLPGLDKRVANDRVVFVVKAGNKFGTSGYSNLAHLTFDELKNVDELGPPDIDGDIDIPKGEDFTLTENGGLVDLNFTDRLSQPLLEIDLSSDLSKNAKVRRIVMPEALVENGFASISVNTGTSVIRFTPITFNTLPFKTMAQNKVAYARLIEDVTMTKEKAHLVPNIRGLKQVTPVHSISFDVSSNSGTQGFNTLMGTMDYSLSYAGVALTQAESLQLKLYRYDVNKGTYVPVQATIDRVNKRITARIKVSGHYVILTSR